MIYDGLGYFLVLTGRTVLLVILPALSELFKGVNVFNLILYRASDKAVQVSVFPLKLHNKLLP